MNRQRTVGWLGGVALAVTIGAAAPAAADDARLAGRWDAVVVAAGVDVPFPFEIVGDGTTLRGSFFNGERRITSTSATVTATQVVFRFEQYASTLTATLEDGRLTGEYRRARGEPYRVPRRPRRRDRGRPPTACRRSTAPGSSARRATRARRRGASSPTRRAPTSRRRSCASTATPAR